ncbi:MAG TPA: LysR substrate-binding domain-containing protein, partial [Acetobacteraceae bacterium]|nr:LysR substrate-binding domain-containing protein [Acetobacteraceae bacterium]
MTTRVELRHWRAFVTAAETEHFGAAAERLGITQPALSQLIRALEAALGLRLFDRSGHRMRASAAARELLPQASAAVQQADIAERSGEAIGRRARRAIALGYVGSAPFHPLFAGLIQGIEAVRPAIPLRLDQCSGTAQVRYLLDERIDVGIVRSPLPALQPEIASLALARERMVLARPAAGRRDDGDSLSLAALAGAPFIVYVEQPHGGLRHLTLEACRDAGFEPRIAQTVPQIATMLCLVGAGV